MPLVDLSAPIRASPPEIPDAFRTDIEFSGHAEGATQAETLLGVPPRLLRDGEGWATETFTRFGTHNSTHVDAPWHYNSRIAGERAQTIDELPLDWFLSPGVVLDMTAKGDGERIGVADVEAELERVGHELGERDIVLVRSGRDAALDDPSYIALGPRVTRDATVWMFERGVRVMGIDAWGSSGSPTSASCRRPASRSPASRCAWWVRAPRRPASSRSSPSRRPRRPRAATGRSTRSRAARDPAPARGGG